MDIKNFLFIKYLQYINGHHSSNTPTNHLAIELQHISKKYPILSVFYHYQKRFKYYILAHMPPPLPYFRVNICPLPLPLNIFHLFVILSLTQLYCYTPEKFLFSTASFKYTYRAPLRRIGQQYSAKVVYYSVNSGLRWIFHMHSEFSIPAMCNNSIMIISSQM